MQKVLNEIRQAQVRQAGLKIPLEGIYSYVHSLSHKECRFCLGFGHTAKNCSTKKDVDTVCKRNPEWKMAWGSVKSVAKRDGVVSGIRRAQGGIQQDRLRARPAYE